jgi:penicillin amidase
MRKVAVLFGRVLTTLGVLVLLAAALLAGLLWLTLPGGSRNARIPGLSAPVDIAYDSDGIPRIKAANDLDAAAALGFVHARERLFQMDLMRRNASGRLSEIAGPATLAQDKLMRTLGLRRAALADYAALPENTRKVLEAYARGVNAWIDLRGRFAAPEFVLLGRPEYWEPVDSLLWAKTMGLWLSMNWRTELVRLGLSDRVPQRLIDELWPSTSAGDGHPDAMRQLPTRYAEAAGTLNAVLPRFPAPYTLPGTASNEWAVDGRHTATGAPLLAGDPHLRFGFPAIWYLARIETPGFTLTGATAPGVPGVILGHNGHIAWTFTTTGADTQDIFIETPAGNGSYQTPDGPQPFAVREERIKVRGRPDVVLTVRSTRHGPVISDLHDPSGPVLAVSMANLAPGDTAAAGLFALNHARTVEEAGKAAAMISSPVQNLLAAGKDSIGLFVTGRVPIRRAGDGAAPVPGDGSHDWVGWASGDQLPHEVAPASGRLVNANERIAPPDFPVFLGRDWFGDWRARRIREMLEGSDRHTAEGFARMQIDISSSFARQVLPALLGVTGAEGVAAKAQALLHGWDGSMAMDLPQPLVFNAWIGHFYAAVLRHNGIGLNEGGPVAEFVAFVLSPPGAHWCGGDCNDMLQTALKEATAGLTARFGGDPAAWRWGEAHKAVFAHPVLAAIPLLKEFGTLTIETPGDDTTVDRGETPLESFRSVHGPEYRGVYDLADLDRSLFVVAPGQTGNPFSPKRDEFLRRWRDGATVRIGPLTGPAATTIRLSP